MDSHGGKEVTIGKIVAHFSRIIIVKKLQISVEHDRVVTTLTIIKH